MKLLLKTSYLISAFFCFLRPVYAHINPDDHNSFFSGFSHPFSGIDHLLVMMMVGLWASQLGKKALWAVPIAFVVAMGTGCVLAFVGMRFSFEPAILASVVTIGLITAVALRLPTWLAMGIVSVFAVFHGHIHAKELAEAISYGSGFILATILLHTVGIIFGIGTRFVIGQESSNRLTRMGGVLTILAGLYLFFVT